MPPGSCNQKTIVFHRPASSKISSAKFALPRPEMGDTIAPPDAPREGLFTESPGRVTNCQSSLTGLTLPFAVHPARIRRETSACLHKHSSRAESVLGYFHASLRDFFSKLECFSRDEILARVFP